MWEGGRRALVALHAWTDGSSTVTRPRSGPWRRAGLIVSGLARWAGIPAFVLLSLALAVGPARVARFDASRAALDRAADAALARLNRRVAAGSALSPIVAVQTSSAAQRRFRGSRFERMRHRPLDGTTADDYDLGVLRDRARR